MFRFQQNRLQLKQKLGKGRFGVVFPYQKDPQDLKWAVKRIKAEDPDALVTSLPEIVLGFACDHPRIVPVKGYFIEKDSDNVGYNVYLKLPRMKESLLENFKERKRKNSPYSEEEIIRYFYSLVCGINYLHNKKIYHQDIKPDNLLLDYNGVLKIGDAGIARHVADEDSYQTLTGSIGTYQYSAPEILGENPTKQTLPKADIWSIGAVVLELCLFDFRMLNSSLSQDKLQSKLDELFKNLEGKYHDSLMAFIQKILSIDPKQRPDIAQIKIDLEKDFSKILEKELISDQNLAHKDNGPKVETLKAENSQLKQVIIELENDLAEQKQQHEERIKVMVGQSSSRAREERSKQEDLLQEKIRGLEHELIQLKTERQKQSEVIVNTNKKLKDFEEQMLILKLEKASHQERNNELEKYIETVKNQMRATYEAQIKQLHESWQKEKAQSDQEKNKLLKDLDALQLKAKKSEGVPVQVLKESSDEDYVRNLHKVVEKLVGKWNELLNIKAPDGVLRIVRRLNTYREITDKDLSAICKDLIEALHEHSLHNLVGLALNFFGCYELTDKALEEVAKMISSQPLRLQHLEIHFGEIDNISDFGVENLATAVEKHSKNLQELNLSFLFSQVTSEKIESLKERFAHIQGLRIFC